MRKLERWLLIRIMSDTTSPAARNSTQPVLEVACDSGSREDVLRELARISAEEMLRNLKGRDA